MTTTYRQDLEGSDIVDILEESNIELAGGLKKHKLLDLTDHSDKGEGIYTVMTSGASGFTINLPTPTGSQDRRIYCIKESGLSGNLVTLRTDGIATVFNPGSNTSFTFPAQDDTMWIVIDDAVGSYIIKEYGAQPELTNLSIFSANKRTDTNIDPDTAELTLIGSGYYVVNFSGMDPSYSTIYDNDTLLNPSGRSLTIKNSGTYRVAFRYSNGNVPSTHMYIRVNGIRTNISVFTRSDFNGYHGEGILELSKDDELEFEILQYDLWQASHFILHQLSQKSIIQVNPTLVTPETLSYLHASMNSVQSTTINDHIRYDKILSQIGSNITLDISSPYTTALGNVASVGRITLKANKHYHVTARFRSSNSHSSMHLINVQTGE